ncbi:hypothetical protein GCM10017783_02280 [Deinococcus piscis]|uniref:Glycosyltransferase 2-like domain-containing protein n=1 Tax=Deinococcus piscis TaxID=394230 RepID=A0ABQ3JZL9_9DEIO|nr:hypothetical protein GCM10017783_02280 [Deinococcus piscis]
MRALGLQDLQREGRGTPVMVQAALLVNNTSDRTAELACQEAARWPQLRLAVREVSWDVQESGVVRARREALDWAAQMAGEDGIIVSTDADTRPSPDWLWQLTAPLRAGQAQASAGRILLDPSERAALPPAVRCTHLLDSGYRWWAEALTAALNPDPADPWPRHWQHFGASLALTVRAYRAVGGIPAVDVLEDMALVQALRRQDMALRHTPAARVYTSARRSGRVALGLSTQLQEWAAGPAHWRVPGGAEVAALARAEAGLRRAWQGHPLCLSELSRLWRVPPDALTAALQSAFLGQALEQAHAARLAGEWSRLFAAVPVAQALGEVRAEWALARAYASLSGSEARRNTSSR